MQSSEIASSRSWAPPRAPPAPRRASSDRNRSPRRLYGAGYARRAFFSRDACSKSSVFATFALSGLVRAVVRARGALRWRTKRCAPSPGPRRPHCAPFPRPDPCILSRERYARAAAAAARAMPTVVCLAWLAGQGLRARLLLSAPSSESVRWAPCRLARPCPAYRLTGGAPALVASEAGATMPRKFFLGRPRKGGQGGNSAPRSSNTSSSGAATRDGASSGLSLQVRGQAVTQAHLSLRPLPASSA